MSCPNISHFDSSTNPPLVLIADDDDLMRLVLRQAMEDEGYQVEEAYNGQNCLTKYEALQPALVLLDGQMPIMDGFTCCEALHRCYGSATAPILMVTSLDDSESIERAFAVGASDYITKPFSWAILSKRVRQLLSELELRKKCHHLFNTFESRVQERTAHLKWALDHEIALNRITTQLFEAKDENQILHTAVQELAQALEVSYCSGAIAESGLQSVYIQTALAIANPQKLICYLSEQPEITQTMQQGQFIYFCSVTSHAKAQRVSLMGCPIQLNQKIVGALWLIVDKARSLTEPEIQLVQHVADQCAIAIHRTQGYQAAHNRVLELEHLNQIKDDFLSTVVHELRSPLSNMRLATHTLGRLITATHDESSNATAQKPGLSQSLVCLNILQSECEKELKLVNDLLDLQRLETAEVTSLEWVSVSLKDWILHITEMFDERLKAQRQTLTLDISDHSPATLNTDSNALERILKELITNACKYSPPGEMITVAVDSDAQHFHLSVTNSGVEIPQSEFLRIFDRFYRIPNGDPWRQGGSGLGLELVRRLVKVLNGSIEVKSSDGSCCFTVKLPRSPEAIAQP